MPIFMIVYAIFAHLYFFFLPFFAYFSLKRSRTRRKRRPVVRPLARSARGLREMDISCSGRKDLLQQEGKYPVNGFNVP